MGLVRKAADNVKKSSKNKDKKYKNQEDSKDDSAKEVSLEIYARVRRLMPWEPEKVSLRIDGSRKIQNKSRQITNEYTFSKVFKPKDDNKLCFDTIVMPVSYTHLTLPTICSV